MDFGIKGKNVLVVGASKGIGKAIALGFSQEGARVTTIARTKDLLVELNQEMTQMVETDHAYYVADVMDGNANGLAKGLVGERGVFDIVVHNVGGSLVSRNALGTLEEWQHAWKFNAGVAIDMNNVLIQPMIDKGWGRVIHVSSISAVMLRGNPLYASAKAFLNAYVTTVGRTIADTGVVMSAVMPGAVAFPGSYWDRYMVTDPARCEDFLRHHQAVNRFGTTKEIADVVLFLASEQASFMQGALVPVDGANM
jgi:3-oxoacyl-[acyl-carrier protein] reductase